MLINRNCLTTTISTLKMVATHLKPIECKMISIFAKHVFRLMNSRHIKSQRDVIFVGRHGYATNAVISSILSPTRSAHGNNSLVHNPRQILTITSVVDIKTSSRFEYKNTQIRKSSTRQFLELPYLEYRRQFSARAMAKIISGKEVSEEIRAKLTAKVEAMKIKPKLAIVQVGGRQDSNVYIRMKIQYAQSIGASAEHFKLSKDITEDELAKKVQELNQDPSIHGIITQLPFDTTSEIDSDKIVNLIDPRKDVDGLSVYSAGKLSHGELNGTSFVPCTPNGCIELIKKSGIKIEGSHSVVIGRSKIVGSPMAQLLLWHNSTVTICHSRSKNIEEICRQADILVAAVGRDRMVKKSWLKKGAVVIDCGINVIPDATKKSGTRLTGDVDFEECKEIASAITPVPGGVGPMTVAMLISNTVEACERFQQ